MEMRFIIIQKRLVALSIIVSVLACSGVLAQKQQKIGTNANNINSSAVLELESNSRGFLPPRMTLAQRNTIVSAAAGLIIYCSDCGNGEIQFYNSVSAWQGLRVVAGGSTPVSPQAGGAAVCNGTRATVVVELVSTSGKIWMDRNLGASQAATLIAANDYLSFGCLYQWGRGNDGHASITWTANTIATAVNAPTGAQSSSDTPVNALFITSATDWRNPENTNLWQGASQTNNPCDAGFRVPTDSEFAVEFQPTSAGIGYNIVNASDARTKGPTGGFKFVTAGRRSNIDGSFIGLGSSGSYWTSTVSGGFSLSRDINSGGTPSASVSRANGVSVRCIKI